MSKVLAKVNNAHNGAGIWALDWHNNLLLTGSMSTRTTSTLKLWSLTGSSGSSSSTPTPQPLADLTTSSSSSSSAAHLLGITAARFSRTDALAATASLDGALRLWDLSAPRTPLLLGSAAAGPAGALALALDPRGNFAATGGAGGKVARWRAKDAGAAGCWEVCGGNDVRGGSYVTALGWNRGNDVIGCGSNSGNIYLFSSEKKSVINGNGFASHSRAVRRVVFGGDGKMLFSAGDDGLVNVHDVRINGSNAVVATYGGHKGKVLSVAVAEDSCVCATGGSDGVVKVWDARASWKERSALCEHKDSVWDLAFSEDRSMLASVSDDGALIIYSTI